MALGKLTFDSSEDVPPIPLASEALKGVPHPPQNCASAGLSLPHIGQFIPSHSSPFVLCEWGGVKIYPPWDS